MDQTPITRNSTEDDVRSYLLHWRKGLKPENLNKFEDVDGADLLDTDQTTLEKILGEVRGALLWKDLHSTTPENLGTFSPPSYSKAQFPSCLFFHVLSFAKFVAQG